MQSDDMPGHVKSTLIGASINIPITNGKFNLGTWQGMQHFNTHRHVLLWYGDAPFWGLA